MNYKIMAASVIVTGAILATSITLTTSDGSDASQVVERLSTVDIAGASTSYAAPHAATNYEPAATMAKTPGRGEPIPANTT
ncbi:hypothetical protein GCM10023115_12660 [Pontixanthobacter gangjinensis]|uniref:Secreted protein n=1 Tax=Pontixanthobacter gangjinensis TaxID=1028742 RepID=A0A6I4SKU0_9SPHN|nr:hypothetical protein [Pontixanthobacter gangjinensis]MXO56511.1 hypothetical protein [Pontixanthobacter gangjinensis]